MSRAQHTAALVLLGLGLAMALYSCWLRVRADREYNGVMVLVDWHALNSLASTGDDPITNPGLRTLPWDLLREFDAPLLCYGEETVGTLLDQGIFNRAWLTTDAPAYIVREGHHANDIAKGAARHGYWYQRSPATNGNLLVQFPQLPEEDLRQLPVAWLHHVTDDMSEAGATVLLRPGGSEFLGETGLAETIGFCYDQPLVLFQGPAVLGYSRDLSAVARQLQRQQQYFGWVEFDEQDGGSALAAQMAPNVLRVHSIPPEEMVNYDVDSAVARYMRAINERNIRCIYVRPFVRGKVITAGDDGYRASLAGVNQRYFNRLQQELTAAGYTPLSEIKYIGGPPASPTGPVKFIRRYQPGFTALATGAALVLLLAMWLPLWPRRVWPVLLGLTVLTGGAAIFVPAVDSAVLLAAALAFPLLGLWWAMLAFHRLAARPGCRTGSVCRLPAAMLALLIASATTIAGGLLIHGGMWDAAAMLKITQFRGVTLALALPVLLLAAYAWQAETLNDAYDAATLRLTGYWQRFMALWQAPIRYGDVAFILIALGAVGLVLMRSGNDSPLGLLSLEGWFRDGLEQWLTVRPRTKELIGHPLLIVFFLSLPWRNRLSLLFGLAGLLGQVSILNTFCHLHTPLAVTIERVLLGLGLGLLSGLVWGAVILAVSWLVPRVRQRFGAAGPESAPEPTDA